MKWKNCSWKDCFSKKCWQIIDHSACVSSALLVLRLVAGSAFIIHGWPKIQHACSWMGANSGIPGFFQFLAALSEFGGGIAWVLGLLTPLASFGIGCTMLVATYFHMIVKGDPFVSTGGGSYELAAAYLCIAVLLKSAGPGRFSLDWKLFGKRA